VTVSEKLPPAAMPGMVMVADCPVSAAEHSYLAIDGRAGGDEAARERVQSAGLAFLRRVRA
jgi:hypothetical protein